jgi:hypothetical protein
MQKLELFFLEYLLSAADMMFVPDAFAFLDPRSGIIFPDQNILAKKFVQVF